MLVKAEQAGYKSSYRLDVVENTDVAEHWDALLHGRKERRLRLVTPHGNKYDSM